MLLDPPAGVAAPEVRGGSEEVAVEEQVGQQLALQRAVPAQEPVHDLQVRVGRRPQQGAVVAVEDLHRRGRELVPAIGGDRDVRHHPQVPFTVLAAHPLHGLGGAGVLQQAVGLSQPPQVVAHRVVHDGAEQRRHAVAEVDRLPVRGAVDGRRSQAAGADGHQVGGAELPRGDQGVPATRGAVDVPPGGLLGAVHLDRGEERGDGGRGHQVLHVQGGLDVATVLPRRRARQAGAPALGEHRDLAGAHRRGGHRHRVEGAVGEVPVRGLPVQRRSEGLAQRVGAEEPAQAEPAQPEGLRGVPRDDLRDLAPQRRDHRRLGDLVEQVAQRRSLGRGGTVGDPGQPPADQRARARADQDRGAVAALGQRRQQHLQRPDLVRRARPTCVEDQRDGLLLRAHAPSLPRRATAVLTRPCPATRARVPGCWDLGPYPPGGHRGSVVA